MLKTFTSLALATAVVVGASIPTSQPAEAGRRGFGIGAGIAAGIIGATVLGAYAYGGPRHYGYSYGYAPNYYGPSYAYGYRPAYGCYRGPRECGYTDVGYRCWRRTICD
jgi:hypothetical protein